MASNKSETLNVRLSPAYKQALKLAAEREHRTISNLIEHLIAKHCTATDVPIGLSVSGDKRMRNSSN